MGIDAEILVRLKRPIEDQECRLVGNRLCEMFGPKKFFFRQASEWEPRADLHVIYPIERWEQDGPTIEPAPGETFLKVSIWSRYYGEQYERGDYPFLYLLGAALEHLIPGAAVWYGGDSSGVLAEPFDQKRRDELLAHFFKVRHEPYEAGFGDFFGGHHVAPQCTLCRLPMRCFGGGNGSSFWRCACGEETTENNGKQVVKPAREAQRAS